MKRLVPIEGLRAWLALWVVASHVLEFSGFDYASNVGWVHALLQQGPLAVNVFMIVSGFVIFNLLGGQRETCRQFLVRRFFRIYPLYILLFLLSIPAASLAHWALGHSHYLTPPTWWFEHNIHTAAARDWKVNIPAHLTLLHGLIPDAWHGGANTSRTWLDPAWSLSLEWQFYFVAPLVFGIAASRNHVRQLGLIGACLGLIALGPNAYWGTAFLPFNAGYFFVGAVSYFIYQRCERQGWLGAKRGEPILFVIIAATGLYIIGGATKPLIALGLWIGFFAVLLENPSTLSARVFWPWFNHPVAQFLGQISFSIYLSHELVIDLANLLLVKFLPSLGKLPHFWALLALTVTTTIMVSALLHRYVEIPGMNLGKSLAARWRAKPVVPAAAIT